MENSKLKQILEKQCHNPVQISVDRNSVFEIKCDAKNLIRISKKLFIDNDFSFGGLIVEGKSEEWLLRYIFYKDRDINWVHIVVSSPAAEKTFPSIADFVHAADWYEREAEDMFGLNFEGHPKLGDFILHDDAWLEDMSPMAPGFKLDSVKNFRREDMNWKPSRIVKETGAFAMPIGPKYSGVSESVHFSLETVGEDVIRLTPRLFYKWRAIEKLAEGKKADEVLLLAERFSGKTAIAHGLAFCRAVEKISGIHIPDRAKILRIFLAELERFRHHVGAIQSICNSTALAVAASQAEFLEEDLLRTSGRLTGHRYLFGLLAIGGLACDLPNDSCNKALYKSKKVLKNLNNLQKYLKISSSFLDRLEQVGSISFKDAKNYGLAGPVARASNLVRDLRKEKPYAIYDECKFDVAKETEGDGYARLRVLFEEARQSVSIMEYAFSILKNGPVMKTITFKEGARLGWAEAPQGCTFHWVRMNKEGIITRYKINTPSFANWHGFHLAAEKFAFQDLPIILSTFNLSAAENDR